MSLLSNASINHGTADDLPAAQTPGNVGPSDMATNQESVHFIGWGTCKVPARWIGQAYDQFTKDAPTERPSKK